MKDNRWIIVVKQREGEQMDNSGETEKKKRRITLVKYRGQGEMDNCDG